MRTALAVKEPRRFVASFLCLSPSLIPSCFTNASTAVEMSRIEVERTIMHPIAEDGFGPGTERDLAQEATRFAAKL